MTIRAKLAFSFIAIMVLFALNVAIYFLSDGRRQETLQGVLDAIDRQKLITAVSRSVDGKIQQMTLLNSVLVETGTDPASADQIQQFEAELNLIDANIAKLLELSSPEDRAEAEELYRLFTELKKAWLLFYQNFGVDQTKAIMVLAMEAEPISPVLQRKVELLKTRQEEQVSAASIRFAALQDATRRLSLGIFAISLTLALVIALWISRHITGRLSELQQGADRIGDGHFDGRIAVSSRDELGQLGGKFNLMAERLAISRQKIEETTAQLRRQNERERSQVERLAAAMRGVEQGDYSQQLPVSGDDVWTALYRGFNLMTQGLRDEARILEVAQDLSGELNIDALIERIMVATTKLLDSDRSSLFLYDRRRHELWSRFAEGVQRQEIRFPVSAGIAGRVFTSGESINVSDPYSHPDFNPELDRKTGYRTESILCMPVINKKGETIGVTQVLNKRGGAFTEQDEARLKGLTSQVSVSLENAQLFEDVLNIKNYNESILKSSSNGLITLDNTRAVVTANEAALKILNASREALLGQPAQQLLGDENSWVINSIAKVEQTGETDISVDADLKLANGKSAAINLTAVPLIDIAEEPIGTLLMFEDMTGEKRVKTTMARYMSKQVVDQLLESGDGHLKGDTKRVSILFADVRNFTNLAESVGARETVTLLNEYFEVMVDIIFQAGGILDKYIGDAIMALFGAPFEGPSDADNAVTVANQMLIALHQLNQDFEKKGRQPLQIGIGIGTGDVVAGSIGSSKRMEYTVIGDSVNLGARLEAANKFYGSRILISEHTVRDLKQPHRLREIDLIRVKGKDHPVAVFEALDYHTEATFPNRSETLRLFDLGLQSYRSRQWQTAEAHFQAALEANPGDEPSRIYVDRCRQNAQNPPSSEWAGVWEMATK